MNKNIIRQMMSTFLRKMTEETRDMHFMAYQMSFFKDIFLKSFFISCVVWGFMIAQFWWGDHDWGYLKGGVKFQDGFFEARYSQHLFTILFFDGNVLPVFSIVCALAFLTLLALITAVYLEIPKEKYLFYIFVLFVSLNPYAFVFFYYVYLAIPFMAWPLVGVCGLFLAEKYNWRQFCLGAVIWFLLLGSYPPNIALIFTLFCAKRLIRYCEGKESFGQSVKTGGWYLAQFLAGLIGFKLLCALLQRKHLINLEMYNIQVKSFEDMLVQIPYELWMSVGQLFNVQTFMGWDYCLLLALPIALAVWRLYDVSSGKRTILTLFLFAVFMASRCTFLISASAKIGFLKMEYFGRLGLELFALSVLARMKRQWVQNFYVLWGVIVLALFVVRDYDVQKIQFLGFRSGREYQARLLDKIWEHPAFVMAPKYISFSFGYPNFRRHYFDDKYQAEEFVGKPMVLDFNIVAALFWEEEIQPVVVGSGVYDKSVLRVDISKSQYWANGDYWKNNSENMKNMRYWVYQEAKFGSVYVDDKYIILVQDMSEFYKNRELILTKLDE